MKLLALSLQCHTVGRSGEDTELSGHSQLMRGGIKSINLNVMNKYFKSEDMLSLNGVDL